jgi:hypothetical protein
MKGWVYVISNKAMPGLVKVGYSMKDPEIRASELNTTGVPHPYLVDFEALVDNPFSVEQACHKELASCREGKEWFRSSPEQAIAAIKRVVEGDIYTENYKRVDRARAEEIARQTAEIRRQESIKEEKRLQREIAIDQRRKEINEKYESLLAEVLPKATYWSYFMVVAFFILILVAILFPNMQETSGFLLVAILSFIITPLVRGQIEEKTKRSKEYQALISKREEELKALDEGG